MSKFKATRKEIVQSHLLNPCKDIKPLQPKLSREKPQKVSNDWQKLLVNAEKVNQLSEQLEEALFELKATASEIKGDKSTHSILNKIFKLKLIVMPGIHYKKPGSIVVTTRKLDLFQQEREAFQVAQMLRRRTERRLKRPAPSKLLMSSKLKHQGTNFIHQLVLMWQKLQVAIGQKQTSRSRQTKVSKVISC